MSAGFPIEADDRVRTFTVSSGQTVFGPFSFKIFDIEDVVLETRATVDDPWTVVSSGVTVTLTGAAPATFTVTKTGLATGLLGRVKGLRVPQREDNATRAGSISSGKLETDLDKLTIIAQETRRDSSEAIANAVSALADAEQALATVNDIVEGLIPEQSITTERLQNHAVTNQKLAQMQPGRIKGRAAGGVLGETQDLTGQDVAEIIVGYTYPINAINYPGIANDGLSDNSSAVLALLAEANGNPIFFARGQYRFDSPVPYSGIVNIGGAGHGGGPGLFSPSGATEFLCNFANPTLFDITTLYPCTFRDFRCSVAAPHRVPGSGRAIAVTGDVGNNANTSIYRVGFDNFYNQVYFQRPNWNSVLECYFQNWKNDAIFSETDGTREGSTGWIARNYFFGNYGDFTGAAQRSAITTRCGYSIIAQNEILGGQYGVNINIANYEAGFVKVIDNTIENQVYHGIRATTSGAYDASMFDFSANEFSNTSFPDDYLSSIFVDDAAGRAWLSSLTVDRNIMRHSKQAALGYIRVAAGANVKISRNLLENVGGTAHALGIGVEGVNNSVSLSGSPAATVEDNQFKGSFTNRYAFSAAAPALLRDSAPMTFAAIPANCAQGSRIHVSDGRATNFLGQNMTLTNGGTVGHPAFKGAAIWLCYGPS